MITANIKALMALPASPVCMAFWTGSSGAQNAASTSTAPFVTVFTVPSGSDTLLG